jgi:hypothetical protein
MNRVKALFAANAKKKEPWKTTVLRFSEDLDIVQLPYAEFLVLNGTILGERRCLKSAKYRFEHYNGGDTLHFVGYITFTNSKDIDGRPIGRVCCAHFQDEMGNDAYVNKRFHEVFTGIADVVYWDRRYEHITYASDDPDAPVFGNVLEYIPRSK